MKIESKVLKFNKKVTPNIVSRSKLLLILQFLLKILS